MKASRSELADPLWGLRSGGVERNRTDPVLFARELSQGLTRLSRNVAANSSVVVVYDSAVEGDREVISGEMFDVVFAPAYQNADDAIVERSGAYRVIVVSNDREVRERCEARGALAIWSDALVAWLA